MAHDPIDPARPASPLPSALPSALPSPPPLPPPSPLAPSPETDGQPTQHWFFDRWIEARGLCLVLGPDPAANRQVLLIAAARAAGRTLVTLAPEPFLAELPPRGDLSPQVKWSTSGAIALPLPGDPVGPLAERLELLLRASSPPVVLIDHGDRRPDPPALSAIVEQVADAGAPLILALLRTDPTVPALNAARFAWIATPARAPSGATESYLCTLDGDGQWSSRIPQPAPSPPTAAPGSAAAAQPRLPSAPAAEAEHAVLS